MEVDKDGYIVIYLSIRTNYDKIVLQEKRMQIRRKIAVNLGDVFRERGVYVELRKERWSLGEGLLVVMVELNFNDLHN